MSERSRADAGASREARLRDGVRGRILGRAYNLLADGEFHDYEVVMRALLPLVPPQLAIRQAEADRVRQHFDRDPNQPAPPRTVLREIDRTIVIGSRAIVRKTLADSAHLEIMPRGRLISAGTIKQIRYELGVSRRPGGKRS